MELKEGAVIADRFRLVRLLGKGGMGEVWAAQHIALESPCAVKFIHAESAAKPEVRARFEREAKAAAQLRSQNVVQILDYGVYEQTPYIAMEMLEGEPLNARLARRGRLDAHETFRIVSQVGRALGKAHAAGIVHRDLKPENIFLVADDEGEIAKVLDFGVAKQTIGLTDSNTKTGALLGTPFYMSPEQAQGTKTVDSRADLWSMAVLCYRCLTGTLPFRSEALGDLLIKIVTHPIPVPSHEAGGLPDGFDAWWERASQREPEGRYQTAKDFIEALGVALGVSSSSGVSPAGRATTGARAGPTGSGAADQSAPSWSDSITRPHQGLITQDGSPAGRRAPTAPFPIAPAARQQPAPTGGYPPAPTGGYPPAPGAAGGPAVPMPAGAPAGAMGAVGAIQPAAATGPHQALVDNASMAGVATQAARSSSPHRTALIGAVLAGSILVAAVSVVFVYRGMTGDVESAAADGAAESAEVATEPASDGEESAPGEETEEPSEPPSADEEEGATSTATSSSEAETSTSAEPTAPQPHPPRTVARPRPTKTAPSIPTDLGNVGKTPKPKSSGGKPDLGF